MSCDVFCSCRCEAMGFWKGRIGHAAVIATVDGKNPAPPEFHKTFQIVG